MDERYYYKTSHTSQVRIGPLRSSKKEIIDLLKAWIAISFAFAILSNYGFFPLNTLPLWFISSLLTVGIGFLFHELSHKVAAQRYGCTAEFRSFDQMLLLAIVMSFFGFILAAPGAVMISGRVTPKQNGIISAAGAGMNLLLALVFLINLLILPLSPSDGLSWYQLFKTGLFINAMLGVFNLIPLGGFDGRKIWEWSKGVYAVMAVVGIGLILASSFI